MTRQRVLILFGGVSNEYEVSLRSACSVLEHIDRTQFDPLTVGITREGHWLLCDCTPADIVSDSWQKNAIPAILSPDRGVRGLQVFAPDGVRTLPVDVIFPAMHGQNCEDGALQGLCKLAGIPFVGCGVTSSALCFDKEFTHMIAEAAGVSMARWVAVHARRKVEENCRLVEETIGFPCFVKPANSGSSVGTSPVYKKEELPAALQNAFMHDDKALVEELITAQEVECAVIGNDEPVAPTTSEIISVGGFYDYNSKYVNNTAQLLIPAGVSEDAQREVRRLAVKVYRLFGCRGLSRVDFFVRADQSVLFNEINTMPGFTSISMYPKMMLHSGYSYGELITKLLRLALEDTV